MHDHDLVFLLNDGRRSLRLVFNLVARNGKEAAKAVHNNDKDLAIFPSAFSRELETSCETYARDPEGLSVASSDMVAEHEGEPVHQW